MLKNILFKSFAQLVPIDSLHALTMLLWSDGHDWYFCFFVQRLREINQTCTHLQSLKETGLSDTRYNPPYSKGSTWCYTVHLLLPILCCILCCTNAWYFHGTICWMYKFHSCTIVHHTYSLFTEDRKLINVDHVKIVLFFNFTNSRFHKFTSVVIQCKQPHCLESNKRTNSI